MADTVVQHHSVSVSIFALEIHILSLELFILYLKPFYSL